mmetsp:Transcript_77857/g.166964  ORF Transcript_77857/g.166964 Transcript_77857/m.166964 type:complete len:708 (-) Transcript_77857:59-2182(-)
MPKLWKITGGADKGGVLCRKAKAMGSPKTDPDRIATGAIVEEIKYDGERLKFKLVEGVGPKEGWLSPSVLGKVLAEPMEPATPAAAVSVPVSADSAPVVAASVDKSNWAPGPARPESECLEEFLPIPDKVPYKEYIDKYLSEVGARNWTPPGRIMPAEGEKVDKEFEKRRLVAEANHTVLSREGVKPLPPFVKMNMGQLEENCHKVLNGEQYGLPVPINLADLQKRGEKFLTQCFQTAGTIGKDQSVKKVLAFKRLPMTGKEAAGGSGPKAFLTVEWAKEDPELHKELFVKMPWDMGTESAKAGVLTEEEQKEFYRKKEQGIDPYYRWKCSANADYEAQESTIYRFLGPVFPFKIPKYYYADICRGNTNYMLCTEKIAFPKKGQKDFKDFQGYDILPVAEKYFDFQLEPRMRHEMYYCIMRSQARMAAWDKLGKFDFAGPEVRGSAMAPPALGAFQFPLTLNEKQRRMKCRAGMQNAKIWKEFMTEYAPKAKLYDKDYFEPDFIEKIEAACMDVGGYKDDIFMYGCLFPDMIGFQHTNLQSDNAFYWYTEEGKMDIGIIDWGGASPGSFCSRMTGSITSCEGDVLDAHEDGFLNCFITEYYKESGIKLDFHEFQRQWMLTYCTYILSCGTNIEMEVFRETPREAWGSIKGIWDDKIAGRWNVRCFVFMIASMLKYLRIRWIRGGKNNFHCHDDFREWKTYWDAKGMT